MAALALGYDCDNTENEDEHTNFMKFVSKYDKSYTTKQEYCKRFEIFRENDKRINDLNKKAIEIGVKAKFEINFIADWTKEEHSSLTGLDREREERENGPFFMPFENDDEDHGRLLQTDETDYYIDWTEKGKVTRVKEQGKGHGICGTCWAFAASTVQESMHAIKYDLEPFRLSE